MKRLTLVLGGARSGKSSFAERLALSQSEAVTYFATADCCDSEMKKRIELHKSRRPESWGLWEGRPEALPEALAASQGLLLLDCLTMWLTRLFLAEPAAEATSENEWHEAEQKILSLTESLCASVNERASLIIVSNEVGFGLVPPYQLGRRFRDLQGRVNQLCAAAADKVVLVVAGCPLWIKGGSDQNGLS